MTDLFAEPAGGTPIGPEEREALEQTREDFVTSLSAQAALWSQIITRGKIVIE